MCVCVSVREFLRVCMRGYNVQLACIVGREKKAGTKMCVVCVLVCVVFVYVCVCVWGCYMQCPVCGENAGEC